MMPQKLKNIRHIWYNIFFHCIDVPEILVVDHMVEIEKALCLLQELSPSILSDNSGDINLLLEGVRKMSKIAGIKDGHEDEVMETDDKSHDQSSDDKSHDQSSDDKSQQRELLPQLYLLKLLSETDARKLPWTQQVCNNFVNYNHLKVVTI